MNDYQPVLVREALLVLGLAQLKDERLMPVGEREDTPWSPTGQY